MIDHRAKDGLHLYSPAGIDTRVIEFRVGWLSRLCVLLTGRVSVWRS